MTDKQKILTTGEVAQYCGVNFRTVIRWIERGLIKSYKLPGRGDNRISADELVRFLRRNNMPVPAEFGGAVPKVLVVDDDEKILKIMAVLLKKAKFDVQTAADGFKAGALLNEFMPDAMVLDLNMPGMSGFDVIKFVRGNEKISHIKIVVVSAMGSDHLAKAKMAGADDVISKPFKSDKLVGKIRKLLYISDVP